MTIKDQSSNNTWELALFSDINAHKSKSMQPKDHLGSTFELFSVPIFPTGHPEVLQADEIGSSKQFVQSGDVLICKINPRINRVWHVSKFGNYSQIASSEWIVFRQENLNSQFFTWYFRSEQFRTKLCADVTGVGGSLTRAQPKVVSKFLIPVPPLAEQKVIADKLDTLLAQVEKIKARLERIPNILKQFRQSVLTAAVSGKLTEEWRKKNTLGDDISTGNTLYKQSIEKHRFHFGKKYKDPVDIDLRMLDIDVPSSWVYGIASHLVIPTADIVYGIVQPGPKLEVGIPYIRGTDIENGKIKVNQLLKTSTEIAKKYERASLLGGDILLGIIRATKVAIIPDDLTGANITQGTARFRANEDAINSVFLSIYLQAPKTQSWLHSNYRGIDMPGLNLKDVRRLPVPVCPLDEQEEIVSRVEELLAFADSIEQKSNAALERVNNLTQSILAKAFRGELTAEWREANTDLITGENSAEALLKKIIAEREAMKPVKKTNKKKVTG